METDILVSGTGVNVLISVGSGRTESISVVANVASIERVGNDCVEVLR